MMPQQIHSSPSLRWYHLPLPQNGDELLVYYTYQVKLHTLMYNILKMPHKICYRKARCYQWFFLSSVYQWGIGSNRNGTVVSSPPCWTINVKTSISLPSSCTTEVCGREGWGSATGLLSHQNPLLQLPSRDLLRAPFHLGYWDGRPPYLPSK